ncbi:hypothetical protein D3C72_1747490 [compost metagenome]
MPTYELAIEDVGGLPVDGIHLKESLHDALQRRGITSDAWLQIGRSNLGRTEGRHLQCVLRIGKALKCSLAQWIEYDDGCATPGHFVQGTHHAWMVRARIVSHGDDQFAGIKIVQRDGSFPNPDRLREPDAGRLMAHVGAVREIVGSILTRKDLVQEGRFIGGASRCVELNHVRVCL